MEQFEKVDKLVEKTGVSYAEAKAALESSGWNLLDALILLEKEHKTESAPGRYVSEPGEPEEEAGAEYVSEAPDRGRETREKIRSGLKKAWAFLTKNKMTFTGRSGDPVFTVPVLVVIILLLASVGTVLVLALIALLLGCGFSFSGPDLGKDGLNDAVNAVGEKMADIGNDIRDRYNDYKEKNGDTENRE